MDSPGIFELIDKFLKDPAGYVAELLEFIETCDLSIKDNDGRTVLHCLCLWGFDNPESAPFTRKVALTIINRMSTDDLNIKNNFRNTALHWLCFNGFDNSKSASYVVEVALAMINRMSTDDLNIKNNFRNTALHWLCFNGFDNSKSARYAEKVALAIINRMSNVDLRIKDDHGNTALDWLCFRGFKNPESAHYAEKVALAMINRMSNPLQIILDVYDRGDNDHTKTSMLKLAVPIIYENNGFLPDLEGITQETVKEVMDAYKKYVNETQEERRKGHKSYRPIIESEE